MNEQRKDILDMLAEGKITSTEAEQLIAALDGDEVPPAASSGGLANRKAKYLRFMLETTENNEPSRIQIRVPLQLLRAGVRLAALIPPPALARANEALDRSGVPFDLTQLRPEQLEALVEQLDELTLDVDDPGTKLRVFCE